MSAARCPIRSTVTERQCELSEGHAMDSAVRFHRFVLHDSDADLPDAMAEYLADRWASAERWQIARVAANTIRRIAAQTGMTWGEVSVVGRSWGER